MKFFLIGLSASGKSTLGKELAAALKILFVDLDAEIEKETGQEIKAIFRSVGERHFRELESRHLKQWCQSEQNFVMATGGGAPCFFDGIRIINKAGTSIFLDVPVDEIVRRIGGTQREDRPLLGQEGKQDLENQLSTMHRNRLSCYHQAHIMITGSFITAKILMDRITGLSG